jgi:hypothetical protein
MSRLASCAVACLLSFGSVALAAPTPVPAPQVAVSMVKVVVTSEEAAAKIEALAAAGSVVVLSPPPPVKGAALPKTLTAELVLDTSTQRGDVRKQVEQLQGLAVIDATKKRPPIVTVVWDGGLAPFDGVVTSIGVKYTLFGAGGTPTRATVNLGMREGQRCLRDSGCPSGQVCISARCTTPAPTPSPPSTAPTKPF